MKDFEHLAEPAFAKDLLDFVEIQNHIARFPDFRHTVFGSFLIRGFSRTGNGLCGPRLPYRSSNARSTCGAVHRRHRH